MKDSFREHQVLVMPSQREKTVTVEEWTEAGMGKAGKSCLRLEKEQEWSITTISNLVRRCKKNGHVKNMKRRRKQRKATMRDLRHMERVLVKTDRMKTVKALASEWGVGCQKTISERTRRTLKDMRYHGRAFRKQPFISEQTKKNRVQRARHHIGNMDQDRSKVVFTAESLTPAQTEW